VMNNQMILTLTWVYVFHCCCRSKSDEVVMRRTLLLLLLHCGVDWVRRTRLKRNEQTCRV
jgi:hypothetical protein